MKGHLPIVQRRLAAVLSADVAGYARLMGSDEVSTLRLLSAHREVTDRLIAQHGGRIANTAGDSVLAEFPSATNAIQCALAIQERIAPLNDEVPEERRVTLRIGVHVGEVMVREGDLFGDGVNVAARMQALAAPGTVCLSGAAHEYVQRVLPVRFDDLGPQMVKNLDRPIRAYLVRPASQPTSTALPPVHRVEAHLARRFHEVCLAALTQCTTADGLTPLDFAVLASLHDAPGTSLQRLTERIGIDLRRGQRLVSRLSDRSLVSRAADPDSRPAQLFSLTRAGAEMVARLRPAIIAAQDRAMAPLSEQERQTLRDLLGRVIKANQESIDGIGR